MDKRDLVISLSDFSFLHTHSGGFTTQHPFTIYSEVSISGNLLKRSNTIGGTLVAKARPPAYRDLIV